MAIVETGVVLMTVVGSDVSSDEYEEIIWP